LFVPKRTESETYGDNSPSKRPNAAPFTQPLPDMSANHPQVTKNGLWRLAPVRTLVREKPSADKPVRASRR
jgi:hypothetical protein